jgi:N-hydroxyarylamine O-acetyltransferase
MLQTSDLQFLNSSGEQDTRFNLDGYFARIGYSAERTPTLETLRQIHLLHAQTIPFENLNPFLRIPVVLDMHSIYQKLVLKKRGGYCFEHNLLLMEVLRSLGFKVKGLAARVLWNQPEGIVTPRGHMLLQVSIEGKDYIADVGFGGLTLTAPLQLKIDEEQKTPHEYFRITPLGSEFVLQAKVQGDWRRIYSFGLQENFLPDYEVTSWYLSNFPSSHFVTGLIAALPFEGGRYTLRNTDFAAHHLDGRYVRKRFETVSELVDALQNTFMIEVPNLTEAHDFLARLVQNVTRK